MSGALAAAAAAAAALVVSLWTVQHSETQRDTGWCKCSHGLKLQ